jgi:predicted 2-oxoglutarate/Fe(II)-dependent dioxygenase YbiX
MKNFIKHFKDVLDVETCNKIIDIKDDAFTESTTLSKNENTVNKNIRKCFLKPLDSKYEEKVFKVVGKIINDYCDFFPDLKYALTFNDEGYTHLLYKSSDKGEYKEHIDSATFMSRTLSCSFILNDNFEGGYFSFFDGEYLIKPIQGSAIVFPSNFCFPHAVTPITKGNRHAIITWIS